jgi:hypothetical protein
MRNTKMHQQIEAAICRQPLGAVRERWLPLVEALCRAEMSTRPRSMAPGAEVPYLESEVMHHAGPRLRSFGSAIAERASGAMVQLALCGIIDEGWGGEDGMNRGAAWSIAWAEHDAFSAGALGASPANSVAVCQAALECAHLAAERLAEADRLAGEIISECRLSPERLHDLAQRSWSRIGELMACIVRYSVSAAPGASGVELHALQASISAIAHAAAETFEWDALSAHTSAWKPVEETEEEEAEEIEAEQIEDDAEDMVRRLQRERILASRSVHDPDHHREQKPDGFQGERNPFMHDAKVLNSADQEIVDETAETIEDISLTM